MIPSPLGQIHRSGNWRWAIRSLMRKPLGFHTPIHRILSPLGQHRPLVSFQAIASRWALEDLDYNGRSHNSSPSEPNTTTNTNSLLTIQPKLAVSNTDPPVSPSGIGDSSIDIPRLPSEGSALEQSQLTEPAIPPISGRQPLGHHRPLIHPKLQSFPPQPELPPNTTEQGDSSSHHFSVQAKSEPDKLASGTSSQALEQQHSSTKNTQFLQSRANSDNFTEHHRIENHQGTGQNLQLKQEQYLSHHSSKDSELEENVTQKVDEPTSTIPPKANPYSDRKTSIQETNIFSPENTARENTHSGANPLTQRDDPIQERTPTVGEPLHRSAQTATPPSPSNPEQLESPRPTPLSETADIQKQSGHENQLPAPIPSSPGEPQPSTRSPHPTPSSEGDSPGPLRSPVTSTALDTNLQRKPTGADSSLVNPSRAESTQPTAVQSSFIQPAPDPQSIPAPPEHPEDHSPVNFSTPQNNVTAPSRLQPKFASPEPVQTAEIPEIASAAARNPLGQIKPLSTASSQPLLSTLNPSSPTLESDTPALENHSIQRKLSSNSPHDTPAIPSAWSNIADLVQGDSMKTVSGDRPAYPPLDSSPATHTLISRSNLPGTSSLNSENALASDQSQQLSATGTPPVALTSSTSDKQQITSNEERQFEMTAQRIYRLIRQRLDIEQDYEYNWLSGYPSWFSSVLTTHKPASHQPSVLPAIAASTLSRQASQHHHSEVLISRKLQQLVDEVYILLRWQGEIEQERMR